MLKELIAFFLCVVCVIIICIMIMDGIAVEPVNIPSKIVEIIKH